MKYAYRLSEAESIEERDSAERAYNKLIRTFAGLVEVYDRRRGVSREVAVAPVSVSGIEKVPPPPHRPRLRLAVSAHRGSQPSRSDNWRRDFGAMQHPRHAASVRVLNHCKNTL